MEKKVITDSAVISSIREAMPVATDTANGLYPSSLVFRQFFNAGKDPKLIICRICGITKSSYKGVLEFIVYRSESHPYQLIKLLVNGYSTANLESIVVAYSQGGDIAHLYKDSEYLYIVQNLSFTKGEYREVVHDKNLHNLIMEDVTDTVDLESLTLVPFAS